MIAKGIAGPPLADVLFDRLDDVTKASGGAFGFQKLEGVGSIETAAIRIGSQAFGRLIPAHFTEQKGAVVVFRKLMQRF